MMMMIMAASSTITPNLSFKKPSFIQWHKMNFHGTSLYPTQQKPSSLLLPFLHHHQYHLIKISKPISSFCVMSSNDDDGGGGTSEQTEAEKLAFRLMENMVSELKSKGLDVALPTSPTTTLFGDNDDDEEEGDEIPDDALVSFSDFFGAEETEVNSDSNPDRPFFKLRDNTSDDAEEVDSNPDPSDVAEEVDSNPDPSDVAEEVDSNPDSSDVAEEVGSNPDPDPSFQDFEDFQAFGSDGYLAVFVRKLGIDYDPLEREKAVDALWKYSLGGKRNIDGIMKFPGCIILIVNLLKSDSSITCNAAARLLRNISSVKKYRGTVAESGAIEEIAGLLSQSSLTTEVKELVLCTLQNLSVDEKFRMKIANIDILPILIKALDDEKSTVKEVASGVLANLALSHSNHQIMVEAGVIPKLAKLLKKDAKTFKVTKVEAKNALLEFAKDEFYRILIIEEGLVLVPMIGADAYKCIEVLKSDPSLPDGIDGASEVLGLSPEAMDEAKQNAMNAEFEQKFLALGGCIEMEYGRQLQPGSLTTQYTLLPWVDGVGRLCLILQLEDMSAISRAAQSIADASISEHMRISFMIAGAVKHLIRLLKHNNENVRLSASNALEKLSASNTVCQKIKTEDAIHPLLKALMNTEIAANLLEKTLNILARILDPREEMKSKVNEVDGSEKVLNATKNPNETKLSIDTTRENILDSAVISRLIEILKTSSPNLQIKAASILEYIAIAVPCMDTITARNIESGLDAVFQQRLSNVADEEDDLYTLQPELSILETEEAGLAISAASRLLTKLLDVEQFRCTINSSHFIQMLRRILKSDIPIHNKEWVAACLFKLHSSSFGLSLPDSENPINTEVTLYETIPRLLEKIKTSFSPEAQELAVIELNTIISKGVVDYSRAVADQGGIFPLVKVMEEGSREAVEASLTILFNLSMDSENHPAIIAAGAVPVLRRIVHSERPRWRQALHLLWTLPTQ